MDCVQCFEADAVGSAHLFTEPCLQYVCLTATLSRQTSLISLSLWPGLLLKLIKKYPLIKPLPKHHQRRRSKKQSQFTLLMICEKLGPNVQNGSTLSQSMWFGDGKAVGRALVSTGVQDDAAGVVLDVAVLGGDAGALQGDVCPFAAQRCPPCKQRKHFPTVTCPRGPVNIYVKRYQFAV